MTAPENLQRELGSIPAEETKCPTCGEQMTVTAANPDGSVDLGGHDHAEPTQAAAEQSTGATAPVAETAATTLPRERGTRVKTEGEEA